jgi:hypothetical protein
MVALAHHWVGQVVRWLRCNSYQDLMLHGHTLTSNTQDKKTRQDKIILFHYFIGPTSCYIHSLVQVNKLYTTKH